MKIVSVVPNSAVRDARIVKQARTLAAEGHDVTIVGVMEPAFPSYRTVIDGIIDVHRVPFAEAAETIKAKLFKRLFALVALLLVALVAFIVIALSGDPLPGRPEPTSMWGSFFNAAGVAAVIARILVFIVAALAVAAVVFVAGQLVARKPVSLMSIDAYADARSKYMNRINMWAKRRAVKLEQSAKIIELKPQLIYCHEAMSLPGCVIAKRALRVPLVYDAHEFYDETEGLNAHLANAYYRKVHSRHIGEVDYFITVSQTIADMYREKYPKLTDKVVILPNSIPKREVQPYDGRLHRAAKLPEDRKILLYQGGISTPRLVHEVANAAQFLPEDWSVVLMGSGRERDDFIKIADRINDAAVLRQARELMTEEQLAELQERTDAYFAKINSYRDSGEIEVQEGGRRGDDSEQLIGGEGGFDIEHYVDNRFNMLFGAYAKRQTQVEKRREPYLRDQLVERLDSVFWETDQLIELKSQMRTKYWDYAQRLALRDVIAQLGVEFAPRISIIDPASQGELLEWTQGASIGVIPYPITSANHWGCAPNKLWEYTGAGVPIISTPSKEISEIIETYGLGWTVSADPKAKEIASLVRSLDEEQIDQAAEGCGRFIDNSNWQLHSRRWLDMVGTIRPAA